MSASDDTAVGINSRSWGEKRKLPSRRNSVTHSLKIGDQSLFLTIGHYPDSMVGEIFINLDREGSTLATICNSWCIAFSYALQYGAPLEALINKYLWTRCEPSGVVKGHPDIVKAYSIPDLVARLLAIEYLGRRELIRLEPPLAIELTADTIGIVQDKPSEKGYRIDSIETVEGYSGGGLCKDCGSKRMRRTGTCFTCAECGSTAGCS